MGMQHVVFVGPQGAGKGTQAAAVAPHFSLTHLSTGDLLRDIMKAESELAGEVRAIMDRGDLVSDETMARILFDALDRRAEAGTVCGALFDGFPRNAEQAAILERAIVNRGDTLAAVVSIDVPRDVLMERLTGRLVCRSCGRTYHRLFNPPAVDGVCDVDEGELYVRSDDTPDAVNRRLEIYYGQTEPLLAMWRERGLVLDVDGNDDIAVVSANIVHTLSTRLSVATATSQE